MLARLAPSGRAAERMDSIALAGNADAPWLPRTIVSARPHNPAGSAVEPAQAAEAAKVLAEGGAAPAADARSRFMAPTSPGGPPASGKPRYTGERISVNLKDVDLTDFFRMIHEVSGLNVIVDSNVSGKVTLVLDSVPWDQALDIVLKNNGLARVLEGNVLRIGRIATLEQEEGEATKLEEAKLQAGPLVTVIRPLKYARAVDTPAAQSTVPGMPAATSTPGVATILKNLSGVLSNRGGVVPDPRSNSLIITDVPSQIPIIESVVDKLDTRPKQISIEARIVSANSNFVRDLTSALNGGTINASGSTATGGTTGTGASAQGNVPKMSAAGTQSTSPGLISLGQTVATGFGAYAIANQSARYFISAAIAAAETRDQLRLISTPTIITQNNVAGKVAQGVEVPYQTTINNTISTQFKDATLELDVTPQVTQDGNVFLLLYVQDDTVGAVVPGLGVSINHQSATTQVLVPDGGTVVFGGIKLSRRAKTVTQVPGLGSVPLLGNLFKSSEIDRNDQELLFFVTPKVLPG